MWIEQINQRVLDAFEQRREKAFSDKCWPWNGAQSGHGYGLFTMPNGEPVLAHRLAFFIETGIDPGGMVVRHGCDNPICVNPHHLMIGTQKENMRDAGEAGRMSAKRKSFTRKNLGQRPEDDIDKAEVALLKKMREQGEL